MFSSLRLLSSLRGLLAGIAILSPLMASAIEPVRVVATGGRIGYTFYDLPAGNTAFRQRTPHKLGGPVAEMQIGFMDWMYTDKTEAANTANDVTIRYAWLERASTGQTVPLTFSGQRTLVLPRDSTSSYWLSDPLPSSSWSGATPARDEVFWLHVIGSVPTGGRIPVGTPTTFSGAKYINYATESAAGQPDVGGTITGSSSRTDGLPVIFLGRYTGPGHLAVIGVGDSIMHGSGDPANPTPVITGYGFFNRAALDANGANTIATFNLTRHGQTASAWMSPGKQQRQRAFFKFANVVAEEYGTNDLGQAGGGDPATILSNVEGIWTAARAEGVQKIVRTLLMPRTNAASAWGTNGQIPLAEWGVGGKRDTINAGLIAARNAGKVDVIVDSLAALADPADAGRWRTDGSLPTTDGTHLNSAGNALMAPPLRAALLSLTVDADRPDYSKWSDGVEWNGKDSSPSADPNDDGVTNLMAYALALPPLASLSPESLPVGAMDASTPNGPWLTLTFRQNATAMDLQSVVQSTTDLVTWNPITPDGVSAILETVSPDVDGNGKAKLLRLRLKQTPGDETRFLRLQIRH